MQVGMTVPPDVGGVLHSKPPVGQHVTRSPSPYKVTKSLQGRTSAQRPLANWHVRSWHFASFVAPHHFGHYRLGADIGRLWGRMARWRLTHLGHWPASHVTVAKPVSAPIKVLICAVTILSLSRGWP